MSSGSGMEKCLAISKAAAKFFGRYVAPTKDQSNLLPRNSISQLKGGCQGGSASQLRQCFRLFKIQTDRLTKFIIAYENEIIQVAPQDSLGKHEGGSGCQAFGFGTHVRCCF